jgi:hypothetical protein
MDFGPESGGRRDVAVGPDRRIAARVFGDRFDSPVVTSYSAFDADVDLASVARIGAVAGPGLPGLLDRLARDGADLWPDRVILGLPADRAGRAELDAALSNHPAVSVAAVTETDRGLVMDLGRAADISPAIRERALATISARPRPAATPTPGGGERSARTPRQLLVPAAAVGLLLLVVGIALLFAIGQSDLGAEGVVVALLVLLLLVQVIVAAGVLYAVRLARDASADNQEQRRLLIARTDRLISLARASAAKDKEALGEIELLQREIVALGRLQARTRVEWLEQSRRDA